MPAAAVIPAPIVYINVAAVKKLVVGSRASMRGPPYGGYWRPALRAGLSCRCSLPGVLGGQHVYFEKIRVLKAGVSLE